jgi:pimeloyl-ACP methyl ester carboxylesterase
MVMLILISTSAVAAAALGGLATLAFYPLLPRDLGGVPNLDGKARRVRIRVGENDGLDAWHLAGTRPAVVLLFHGFGRNHLRSWRYGAFLHRLGYHVVTLDFRSSRWSGRKPTTLGHFELEDAEAALAWVRSEPAFAGFRIGVMGESLGGAVALMLASRHAEVAATVADCAFSSGLRALEDSCQRWARIPARPGADVLRVLGRTLTGCDPARLDVLASAGRLADRGVFLIHSLNDNRLSPEQARQLWRAAGAKDPLWLIPGAGHNEGWIRHPKLYEERVGAFFDHHLLGEGPGLSAGEI